MSEYPAYRASGVKWLDNIPKEWDVKRVKHLFQIRKRIAGEDSYTVLSITQKGVKVKDTESGAGQLSADYSKYQFVEIGDFAMNHMDLLTGYIDISNFEGVTSPDYRVFALTDTKSYPRYFLYIFQLCYINKTFFGLGRGSAQLGRWRLPTFQFKNFYIPFPTFSEQQAIANFLDRKTAHIDTLINKKQRQIELLQEMRMTLTQNAMFSANSRNLRLGDVAKTVNRSIDRQDAHIFTPVGLYNRGRGIFHKQLTKGEDLGSSKFYKIKADDFIISGQFAWEGAVALATQEDDNCVASHRYHILRGNPSLVENAYLFAFFNTDLGRKLLNHHSRGAAGRNRPLNIKSLLKEKILVPPLSIQKSITALVYKEIAMKKNNQDFVDLLNEYRTALISEAVTGKIDVRQEESL